MKTVVERLTQAFFYFVARGLHERDRMLFALLVALEVGYDEKTAITDLLTEKNIIIFLCFVRMFVDTISLAFMHYRSITTSKAKPHQVQPI